jgi:methionyl-tRNA synthetase
VQDLYDKDYIYKDEYEGPYCVGCEEFKQPDDLIAGQGEYAGQLVCPIHRRPVEILSEENYFFRLGDFRENLLAYYEEHPDCIQPESARNEIVNFVRQGLQDLSISRSTFDWGITIPWDPRHVVYVWVDALLNYATAVGYNDNQEVFESRFPADVHLVGRDSLRFHAVSWPAMLMAQGLPLPGKVFANGWLLVGGEKMSKSNLTGIRPRELTDHFGVDAFRWYFLRAISYGQDGSFSWEDFSARYTSELANSYGNLASRVTAMVDRYFGGSLPSALAVGEAERSVQVGLEQAATTADRKIGDELDFQGGLVAIFGFIDQVNGYLTSEAPWKVAKDTSPAGQARLATILYTAAESLRAIAVLLAPFMPQTSQMVWQALGAEEALGLLADQKVQDTGEWGRLTPGVKVTKGAILFPRLEEKINPVD